MADKEKDIPEEEQQLPKKNNLLLIVGGGIALLIIVVAVLFFALDKGGGPNVEQEIPVAEYVVKERMYQLKDGSYLRLGFTIVADEDKVGIIEQVLESDSPGRLPDGINRLLGNKTRDDMIAGSYKREAFARELKKVLEEDVFSYYNKGKDPEDTVQIRAVLISDFVTQSG